MEAEEEKNHNGTIIDNKGDMRELLIQDDKAISFFRSVDEDRKRIMLQETSFTFKKGKDNELSFHSAALHLALVFISTTFSEREKERRSLMTGVKYRPA